MPDVKYIDSDGWATLRRVRKGTEPQHYSRGILIGPPDLSALPLETDKLKALVEALVDARLVNARLIQGNVSALHQTVASVIPRGPVKLLVRYIKSVYQQDMRGEL